MQLSSTLLRRYPLRRTTGQPAYLVPLLICILSIPLCSNANAACTGSGKVWNCSAGSSVAEVQSAVNNATDGATITFAPGNYSWGSTLQLNQNRGITLMCGSVAACNVSVTSGSQLIYLNFYSLTDTTMRLFRISGFRFQNAPAGGILIWAYGNGTLNQLRIDHNTFENFGGDGTIILLGATDATGKYYGVIDNNTVTAQNNSMFVQILGHSSGDNWGPSPKGTEKNLFIEDNTITFATNINLGRGCVDMWRSPAVVWRYNTTQNCLVTAHGVSHGGVINFEVYKNRLIRTANSGGWEDGTRLFHHQGSGEFIAFDNQFTSAGAKSGGALGMTHYRSATPSAAGYTGLQCNGTAPQDGNRSPTNTYYGYPCWRQPGRDGSANLQPMYVWNNRWSDTGGKIDMVIENPWGQSNPSVGDHLKADRDYYNAVSSGAQTSPSSPFNGTTGMGFGTLANRPTSCTTNALEAGGGVGYFATDQGPQGTLYRCSAPNTWTVHYTPFSYPHPLRGSLDTVPPSAPNNLTVLP